MADCEEVNDPSSILFPSSSVISNCGGGGGLSPSNIIVIVVGMLAAVLLMALLSTVALFFVFRTIKYRRTKVTPLGPVEASKAKKYDSPQNHSNISGIFIVDGIT
ncbi:PREDICTED: uncharacterized protein LOC109585072 [Amphimedon queenslandica]|uniref:Uncharacterized protein n=1 Tax=Amphimedon queenslandica TaxID=400682 RepID=A0AAN0JII0_AMPQE|nr:PREDICTED: uncharacterized protein LOC109585072 [Amphimedon queenslandica]|eukprot:XP_019856577.1 PREDICTED: uncharacterized protein LOC109585072 [Amphimedon queenslandica]